MIVLSKAQKVQPFNPFTRKQYLIATVIHFFKHQLLTMALIIIYTLSIISNFRPAVF